MTIKSVGVWYIKCLTLDNKMAYKVFDEVLLERIDTDQVLSSGVRIISGCRFEDGNFIRMSFPPNTIVIRQKGKKFKRP